MRPELRPAPRYHPAASICRSRPAKKYGIREGAPVAPWAASMRLPYLSLLGEDPLGQLGTEMMTSQLAESSYKTYGTGLRSFSAFCATEGVDILDATPQTIVRYLAWLCDRGTVAAGSLQPYLSSINRFLQDHLRAPVALGPLVVSAKKGYAHLQTALTPATPRTFLPPTVAYKILVSAERMCQNPDLASAPSGLRLSLRAAAAVLLNYIFFARASTGVLAQTNDFAVTPSAIVLFKRILKGRQTDPVNRLPTVQVPVSAVPRVAAVLSAFLTARQTWWSAAARPLPAALWALPSDSAPDLWNSSTMTQWLQMSCTLVGEQPPPGFVWTSHSLRSGAATAANAAGVPLPQIRFFGDWATNSSVVLDYIDPTLLPSPAGELFFGWLSPLSSRGAASV